jgi:endogenous inhibitor of DNA gyrase (YacG/DUF329 family)
MIKVRCPICHSPMAGDSAEWPDFPFCSPRCKLIDLGRWLGEEYRVSAAPDDDDVPEADEGNIPP